MPDLSVQTPLTFQAASVRGMMEDKPLVSMDSAHEVGGHDPISLSAAGPRTSSFMVHATGSSHVSSFLTLDDGRRASCCIVFVFLTASCFPCSPAFVVHVRALSTSSVVKTREGRHSFAQVVIEVLSGESKDDRTPVISVSVVSSVLKGVRFCAMSSPPVGCECPARWLNDFSCEPS
jgi:hypothetical protein